MLLALANILEQERLRKRQTWDTRTIHPVRQGRGEALCPQKDQKQHPTKAQEWEMSVDLARKLQFPPSYSNIPEA